MRGYIAANGEGYRRVNIHYVHIDINQILRDLGTDGVAREEDLFAFVVHILERLASRERILFHCALPCRWLRSGFSSSRWPALAISYG